MKRLDDRLKIAEWNRSEAARASAAAREAERAVDKRTDYSYNKDGTIVVTHDLTKEKHPTTKSKYEPYAVVDILNSREKQRNRTLCDGDGKMIKQIHSGAHGHPKQHSYGEHGEHAHDIVWKDGKISTRKARELTEQERKEHADLLQKT